MEMLDIVDENNKVIGTASYADVYEKKHPHRIVHVLLFNDKGEMALQLRSKHKKFAAGHWSTAVGGHVQSGESYEEAALREMEEEIGIRIPVTKIGAHKFEAGGFTKYLEIFRAEYDGPFEINPEEVDKVEYFSMEEIKQMVADGEKFHQELLFLLREQYGIY